MVQRIVGNFDLENALSSPLTRLWQSICLALPFAVLDRLRSSPLRFAFRAV